MNNEDLLRKTQYCGVVCYAYWLSITSKRFSANKIDLLPSDNIKQCR